MELTPTLPTPEEELAGQHGEVFTRRWVVELILDLVGYTSDRDLGAMVAIEPACGSGAFVVPMIERLIDSARSDGRDLEELVSAIRAFDLLAGNVHATRAAASELLVERGGLAPELAHAMAANWIVQADFLLSPPDEGSTDFVVGNPPYIRLEAVPRERSDNYRRACLTMGGRADVYVGFYELGLLALRPDGALGFICADRWMRNAYGARLRGMVSEAWSVDAVLQMTGVDAFEEPVDAYPAITVIRRTAQTKGPVVLEAQSGFNAQDAAEVVRFAEGTRAQHRKRGQYAAARLQHWFDGQAGWPQGSPERLAVLADLEAVHPPLEDGSTGTRVGIGVATGADRIFIVEDAPLVEPERLLPLALARDISSGRVRWSGKYLVNPWDDDGLVDLDNWPGMAAYLQQHEAALSRRHTAQRGHWHRTIDRVIDGLAARPKLYLPDFKDVMFPVLDAGETYPHHNLYWVTSDEWDVRVLGGLLMSDVANLFIEAYSVRMRGGFLRFQAQYLRRIRVPARAHLDGEAERALAEAFDNRDRTAASRVALELYGLGDLPPR